MSKSRRTETSRKAERQENPLLEAVVAARSDLRALVMDAGFGVLGSLLEEDRAELCGERYARSQQRRAYRHGYDEGSLVMGGRRVKVRKPRARSVDGQELPLPHWERFKATDPLEERAVEQILCGVTTRKYERSLEQLDDGRASSGTSRSSVSRRFVARTAKQVQQYLAQPLNEVDLPVLVIDGTHMGKHLLVIAMGIDADGVKHVLGVVEGTTESSHVCRSLLRQLIERGMPVERARLVVIDGSKGLRKAVRDTFGEWALIQRCRVHKIKNVLEHLVRICQGISGPGSQPRSARRGRRRRPRQRPSSSTPWSRSWRPITPVQRPRSEKECKRRSPSLGSEFRGRCFGRSVPVNADETVVTSN